MGLLINVSAGVAHAADLSYRMPGCRPFALREQATPDSALSQHAKISWYGDSRTVSACVDKIDPASGEQVWSTLEQTLPMLSSGGRSYKQRAMNGTSLRDMVSGKDGLNQPWPQQVLADHSEVMVIAFGTNDASGDLQARRGNGVADFKTSLDSVVRIAMQHGKKVLLVQPYRGCSYLINEDDAKHPALPKPDSLIAPYADAVSEVAAANHVAVARLFALPARCDGPDPATDMPDGLHATQDYTRRVSEVIAKELNRVIADGK